MGTRPKIEVGYNKIRRTNGLDDLARLLFPSNRNHQRVFLAMFLELKYARDQRLPSFSFLCTKYQVSPRVLDIVRARCRKMGVFDHVSKFSPRNGYREGWVFSRRFSLSLRRLGEVFSFHMENKSGNQEQKDRDCLDYV